MTTAKATFEAINIENSKIVLAAVMALVIKPFANDYIQVGKWYVAANACGYFLNSKSGYKFSFRKDQVLLMLNTLIEINDKDLEFITYSAGSGFIYHNQKNYKYKFRHVYDANHFFDQALKAHKANVVQYGTQSTRDGTQYVALVKAA